VPGACAWAAPLPKRELPEPNLDLRLATGTPRVKRGEVVRCDVTVVNRGQQDVLLVQPGDGSDCGWRTPIVEWVVNGKVDGATQGVIDKKTPNRASGDSLATRSPLQPACLGEGFARAARCGNINSLKPDEVFVLKPGAQVKFDGWIGAARLPAETGTVKVAVRYFHIPALQWKGVSLGEHDPAAMDRIRRSAPVTLESNIVEIAIDE
jgi:hypothetical protein